MGVIARRVWRLCIGRGQGGVPCAWRQRAASGRADPGTRWTPTA